MVFKLRFKTHPSFGLQEVEAFAKSDPYCTSGLVTEWHALGYSACHRIVIAHELFYQSFYRNQ